MKGVMMGEFFSQDHIYNAIYDGIKRGIRVALENNCLGSAIILIYSGIDTMAYLNMPQGQVENAPKDYIEWVKRYIKFNSKESITPEELYSARCAVIHTYGVNSRHTRNGTARMIGYMSGPPPQRPIAYNRQINSDLVLLDVGSFAEAFFNGVDQFLIDVHLDSTKKAVFDQRLNWLLNTTPLSAGDFEQTDK